MIIGTPMEKAAPPILDVDEEEEMQEIDDPIALILQHQSVRELEEWFASPFWKAIATVVRMQLALNQQDLIIGGIADRAKAAIAEGHEGPLYTSDEALRGGMVAMEEFLRFPEALKQDLLEAVESRRRQEERDGDY